MMISVVFLSLEAQRYRISGLSDGSVTGPARDAGIRGPAQELPPGTARASTQAVSVQAESLAPPDTEEGEPDGGRTLRSRVQDLWRHHILRDPRCQSPDSAPRLSG